MGVCRDLEAASPDCSIFSAFLWERLTGKKHKHNLDLPIKQTNLEQFTTSCEQPM
jgi:hypothetical protein